MGYTSKKNKRYYGKKMKIVFKQYHPKKNLKI